MSMIKDSELGWSCNGDYYVNIAGTVLSTHGFGTSQLTKTNNGGAIGVEIKMRNSYDQMWYGPLIMSTIEPYARYDPPASTPTKHFVINNVTWYISTPNYWGQNQEDVNHLLPYLDLNEAGVPQEYIDNVTSDSGLEYVARLIIQAAELTILHKLPSAEYLNKFVKRALIKNNEHIVSLIPDEVTLDSQVTENSQNGVTSAAIYSFIMENRLKHVFVGTQARYEAALENDEIEDNTLIVILDDTIDATPTSGSNNPVSSDGVYDALKKQLFSGTHAEVAAAILNGDIEDGTTILYTDDILDLVPTVNSDNFISSGAIYNALKKLVFAGTHAEVATALANDVIDENTLVIYTDETDTIDSAPTENSTNLVTSGGVYTAINNLESSIEDLLDAINGE